MSLFLHMQKASFLRTRIIYHEPSLIEAYSLVFLFQRILMAVVFMVIATDMVDRRTSTLVVVIKASFFLNL